MLDMSRVVVQQRFTLADKLLIGILLLVVEFFIFPGTIISGMTGLLMILTALVMAMVDYYPGTPIRHAQAP